jgi:hypothetical protein
LLYVILDFLKLFGTLLWFISTGGVIRVLECHRTTEKEEEAAKKEKKERNKERKEKERKQRREEDEDGEGVWERVKGGIIPTVSVLELVLLMD